MRFFVQRRSQDPGQPYPCVTLETDNWNDFGIRTLFHGKWWTTIGTHVDLGSVKILEKGANSTILLAQFERLDPSRHCSLGQDLDYYRNVASLPEDARRELLEALCDLVYTPELRERFEAEQAYGTSLLRFSSAEQALREARPLLDVDPPVVASVAPTTRTEFTFKSRARGAAQPHELPFAWDPGVVPARRMTVLIGANGVGKTSMLANLAVCLSGAGLLENGLAVEPKDVGLFVPDRPSVGVVVAVSFSAFDDFLRPIPGHEDVSKFSYKYVGNRAPGNDNRLLSADELRAQFRGWVEQCRGAVAHVGDESVDRMDVLQHALSRVLSRDICAALTSNDETIGIHQWQRMSSGQRIVGSIVAGLSACLSKGSVILCDEPETHLHPGLLSTLVAIFSELLKAFRATCVIGTHHPFVLQQVPADSILVLSRDLDTPRVRILDFQSFGEDLGTLLESALGLTEPEEDWHDVMESLLDHLGSEEAVADSFVPPLGLPARTFLRSLAKKG